MILSVKQPEPVTHLIVKFMCDYTSAGARVSRIMLSLFQCGTVLGG